MRKLIPSILLITLLAITGCQAEQSQDSNLFSTHTPIKGIDAVSMRGDVISFTDYATAEISNTATQIASTTENQRYRQLALAWRLRMATAFHTIAAKQDPRQGLVMSWMLATKQMLYFDEKLAGDPNDAEVAQMVETARAVEENINRIIQKYLPPEVFEKAQRQMIVLAKEKPLSTLTGGKRFDQEELNAAQAPDGVAQILLLPLAPLTGMQGVTDTATAVNRLNNSVATLGLLLDDLPLQARWQAQYMVLDLQTSEVAKSLSAMLTQATVKAERLTTVAEQANKTLDKLPEILDAEHKFINQTLDAQRVKIFEDIKKERIETLAALQKQADAFRTDATSLVDNIQSSALSALTSERRRTMADIDAQRVKISKDTTAAIDHIFYRAMQFTGVLFVAAAILIWFAKRKPKPAGA